YIATTLSSFSESGEDPSGSGHQPRAERVRHDDGELGLLAGDVDLLPVRGLPLVRVHQVGDEVLEMQRGDVEPRADPAPAPNGIILISLVPVMSVPSPSPPGRNRSGANSVGRSHTRSSMPMSATMKLTVVPLGMVYPPSSMSSAGACGRTVCPGGWRRRPSITTAFRYGILCTSSSETYWSTEPVVLPQGVFDFVVELVLDGRVLDELGHDPLQRRGRRVRAAVEELGAHRDHLVVRQRAAAVRRRAGRGAELELQLVLALPARVDEGRVHVLEATAHGEHGPEAAAEEARGDGREEGEHPELGGRVEQQVTLRGGDVAHGALVQVLAEAHGHQEPEDGVLERLRDGAVAFAFPKLRRELCDRRGARRREQPEARRVRDLGHEVAAEQPPARAEVPGRRRRAVGQRGAALHEGGVRQPAVGDGDLEEGAHPERQHRAVARVEAADRAQDVDALVPHPQQVAQHRHHGRPRREAVAGPASVLVTGEQEGSERDGNKEEKPWELHSYQESGQSSCVNSRCSALYYIEEQEFTAWEEELVALLGVERSCRAYIVPC
ncbi:hypothetical protein EJB05_23037, partial [Eragrostis curvula]